MYIACEKCKYNYEGDCDFYDMGSGNEIDMPCYREKELMKEAANNFLQAFVGAESEDCESGDCVSRKAILNKKELIELPDGQSFYSIDPEDIKNMPPVTPTQRWIPVSERLPEDEQEILFSTKTGRVHSGKYHDDDSANQWYSHKDKCRAWNNVVSAWMPLPKPYEPQESEEV